MADTAAVSPLRRHTQRRKQFSLWGKSQFLSECRAGVLPLVCSTFRRLLSGPSACLWPDIVFDADTSQLHERARALDFLSWLRRHAQHSRTVEVRC
jgi:hypothetical protein